MPRNVARYNAVLYLCPIKQHNGMTFLKNPVRINFSVSFDMLESVCPEQVFSSEAVAIGEATICEEADEDPHYPPTIDVTIEFFKIEIRNYQDGERIGQAVIKDGYNVLGYQNHPKTFARLIDSVRDAYEYMVAYGESESASIYKEAQKTQYLITTHEAVEVAA